MAGAAVAGWSPWFLVRVAELRRVMQFASGIYLAENLVQGGLILWKVIPPNVFLTGTQVVSSALVVL